MAAKPTLEEAREHLGIDYTDDMSDKAITRKLEAAYQTVLGAVGKDVETYLPDDPRVKELTLTYLEDLWDQRGVSAKVTGATRRMVSNMVQQLQLELDKAKAAAEVSA